MTDTPPKTKVAEVTLYRYSALPNNAKDAAKHHVGQHWYDQEWHDIKHMAKDMLAEKGVTLDLEGQETLIDVSFCQGSGMSIKGRWDLSDFDECEPILNIATDYPHFRRDDVTVTVTQNDHHYVHEYTMQVECEWNGEHITIDLEQVDPSEFDFGSPEQMQLMDEPLEQMAERITEVLRGVCKEIHGKLENHILSDLDGYIDEWMDMNGYWFDEDGQIIERDED